ncbi:MAG TPA: CBS domain-containing protein [Pseudonocardiaceae bacterium]|nr:CBS domain-containing protein [Pseudonocardiaceae bacterium]
MKYAASLLATNGLTALPVLDEDGLIGIVTESGLVRDRFLRDPRYRSAYEADVARHGRRAGPACRDGGGGDDHPGDRHGCGNRCGRCGDRDAG